ncbi:MAG: GNAT family N-acetyltransferase [Myxococcota bacterium]
MSRGFVRARRLGERDYEPALALLRRSPEENLVLVDFVERLREAPLAGESAPQVFGAFDGDRPIGLACAGRGLALSAAMPDPALEALRPLLLRVPSGLIKSDRGVVGNVWETFERAGRRATIDRIELAYRLRPEQLAAAARSLPGFARPARPEDLDDLVYAARASLWEEGRPDPAETDPSGFRRWVEGRLGRARVVSQEGRTVFVAYADVRRPEGWLIQGVYTWPEVRRRGFARRGMDSVVREAFAAGATHVQLAVVDGNDRATALYRGLGFEPFAELRTILFH